MHSAGNTLVSSFAASGRPLVSALTGRHVPNWRPILVCVESYTPHVLCSRRSSVGALNRGESMSWLFQNAVHPEASTAFYTSDTEWFAIFPRARIPQQEQFYVWGIGCCVEVGMAVAVHE